MASSETPSFGSRFRLTLVTDDPAAAETADRAGVDRIGLDTERLDKAARQSLAAGARISSHRLDDLRRLKPRLAAAELFCRLDPPHPDLAGQVETALALGADVLMLPYFRRASDAAGFVRMVAGRARVVLLVETAAAAWSIEAIAALDGVDEIMVGLNDLALDTGMTSRFALLASPLMSALAATVRAAGKRFSAGGLGRWDDEGLPTSADLVCAQYPRLGAEGAWLARSFDKGLAPSDWPGAIKALRERLDFWACQDEDALEAARRALAEA